MAVRASPLDVSMWAADPSKDRQSFAFADLMEMASMQKRPPTLGLLFLLCDIKEKSRQCSAALWSITGENAAFQNHPSRFDSSSVEGFRAKAFLNG